MFWFEAVQRTVQLTILYKNAFSVVGEKMHKNKLFCFIVLNNRKQEKNHSLSNFNNYLIYIHSLFKLLQRKNAFILNKCIFRLEHKIIHLMLVVDFQMDETG